MAKVTKRTFSLTEEQAAFIDKKVVSGGYASGSEVVREGLRNLQRSDEALEAWLRQEVVPIIERLERGEERVYTQAQVRERLRATYRELSKAAE